MNTFPFGKIICRRKNLAIHKGLSLGPLGVFHLTPSEGVHISTLNDFAKNKPVWLDATQPFKPSEKHAVMNRVNALVAEGKSYGLFSNNCEIAVARALGQAPKSPQANVLGTLALLLGLAAIAR